MYKTKEVKSTSILGNMMLITIYHQIILMLGDSLVG